MSNFHRLIWIDEKIRRGCYPNSRTIAGHFEISQRQAQRDIEYLKDSMGAPLSYSASKNGYYYSDGAYQLPSGYLSEEERKTLAYLSLQYRMAGGSDAERLADLFSRLGNQTRDNAITISDSYLNNDVDQQPIKIGSNHPGHFIVLEKSRSLGKKVRIVYQNAAGEVHPRVLHPYKLFKKAGIDYVVGFCELREEIRVFKISRIREISILEDGFSVSKLYDDSQYGPSVGFSYREPYTAVISFSAKPKEDDTDLYMVPLNNTAYYIGDGEGCYEGIDEGRVIIRGSGKKTSQVSGEGISNATGQGIIQEIGCETFQDTDGFAYKISFSSSEQLLSKLLSQGTPFRIAKPAWLKERLRKRLNGILNKNL